MATPFVQGRLRNEPLSVAVQTECAHCARPIHLHIDSHLTFHVEEEAADPLVFVPLVNFSRLTDPSIIDAF